MEHMNDTLQRMRDLAGHYRRKANAITAIQTVLMDPELAKELVDAGITVVVRVDDDRRPMVIPR